MKLIGNMLRRWPEYQTLAAAVKQGALPAAAAGLSGIHKCCVLAALCQETGRKALVLAADEAEAQRFSEDLFALGMRPALLYVYLFPGHGRRLPRIRAPAAGGPVPAAERQLQRGHRLYGRGAAVHPQPPGALRPDVPGGGGPGAED